MSADERSLSVPCGCTCQPEDNHAVETKRESHELAAIVFCAAMLVVLLEWTIVLNSCGGSLISKLLQTRTNRSKHHRNFVAAVATTIT